MIDELFSPDLLERRAVCTGVFSNLDTRTELHTDKGFARFFSQDMFSRILQFMRRHLLDTP